MPKALHPNVDKAMAWGRSVLRGKVPACRYIHQAIQRHFDDVAASRKGGFKFKFDPAKAEKKLKLIQLLPHTKGEWAFKRQLITLEPWQLFGMAVTFGWVRKKGGYRRFRESYWEVPRKNGKALAVDTPIPTPDGWKMHGDLRTGDMVFGVDGKPQRVIAVTDHYMGPSMALTLSDRESIIAHERHEWVTERTWFTGRPRGSRQQLPPVETVRIAETLRMTGARPDFVHRIRLAKALVLPEAQLPVDPYVLGAWLGDGTSGAAQITSADPEIPQYIRSRGVPCVPIAKFAGPAVLYRLSDGDRSQAARNHCLAARLRELGVLGKGRKHIPPLYLRASRDQRLELLRGLIDTDGYISARGQVVFSTIRERLSGDFIELVRSLGMKPTLRVDRAVLNGKDCGANYEIQFWPPEGVQVARLERKAQRQVAGKACRRSAARTVVSVEPVGERMVNCIQVETGVYLAGRGFVPTHNSVIAAGVGISMFVADGEFGAEVYSGATTEKQAWEVFRPAKLMVSKSPMLIQAAGIEVNASNMNIPSDFSRFEPLIGDPGDGASPSCAIVDEYHEHRTSAQYDTMLTGMGARRQPLMFIITTAGADIEGPCYDKRRQVIEMLEGTVPDDELFGFIWTLDEGDDWTDPKMLAKANPNHGVSVFQDYLESMQARAIRSARFTNTFKTKHLNLWVSAKSGFFNMESWRACEDTTLTLDQFAGQEWIAGFDLARKLDMNSRARLFWRVIDGRIHYYSVAPKFWVPEDTAFNSDNKRMSERFQAWINSQHLDITDGAEVDYREILEDTKEANHHAPLRESPIDPFGATGLSHELDDEGFSPITITQNYTNMSDPMKELEAAIESGRFHHDGNPIMTWCVANVIGKNLPGNNDVVRPIKQGDDNKIDGAVALIMAIGRVLVDAAQNTTESFMDSIRNPIIA